MNLTDDGVQSIAQHTSSLTELSLNLCRGISDKSLLYLNQSIGNLKRLRLNSCIKVTDEGLLYLKQKKLDYLAIIGCYMLTKEGIRSILSNNADIRLSLSFYHLEEYENRKNSITSIPSIITSITTEVQ